MKMKIALTVLLATVFLICCGCGKTADSGETNTEKPSAAETKSAPEDTGSSKVSLDELMAVYQTPAQFAAIDLTAADPSNDVILFKYDDQGRVDSCVYQIDGQQVVVMYMYKKHSLKLLAAMSGFVVADETVELPGDFDPELGFSAVQGYYVKGFAF